jgi:protease-4
MKKIALVEICGNLSYENPSIALLESFVDGADVEAFDGLILWINSGGGSFCCAQDIYATLQRSPLPRLAVAAELCASAAYYLALSAHRILAQPASLIGGLCASLEVANYSRLHDKVGVSRTIHSRGSLKQMLTPFSRQMADGEQAAIDDLLSDMDEQFHRVILERRPKLQAESPYTDGRLFSGARAHKMGVVDGLGGLFEASRLMAQMLDVSADNLELVSISADEQKVPAQQTSGDMLATFLAALRL